MHSRRLAKTFAPERRALGRMMKIRDYVNDDWTRIREIHDAARKDVEVLDGNERALSFVVG